MVLCLISACATSQIKKSQLTDQKIEAFNLLSVRMNRPDFEVPDLDDFTHSDRALHCETPKALWSKILLPEAAKSLVDCLNSLGKKEEEIGHYLYIAKTQPFLKVDPAENATPSCLARLLPMLPLPREIYFLGKTAQEREQQCYAMSLNTKATQIANGEMRALRFEVKFLFPLLRKLKSPQDLEIWLLVSTLGLFQEDKSFFGSPVPERWEQACFGDDPLFQDKKAGKISPVFWP